MFDKMIQNDYKKTILSKMKTFNKGDLIELTIEEKDSEIISRARQELKERFEC
jgi:hypothetical protein